jgi:hypothetical protein
VSVSLNGQRISGATLPGLCSRMIISVQNPFREADKQILAFPAIYRIRVRSASSE